jgi:alanyl-tRNA synthetase
LSKLGTGVILLIAVSEDNKIYIVCSVSKDLTNKGLNAGNIIKLISPILGAKGGGKADFAQAGGGSNINNISLAITEFENYIKEEKYVKR